jgi:hypothetical protein
MVLVVSWQFLDTLGGKGGNRRDEQQQAVFRKVLRKGEFS